MIIETTIALISVAIGGIGGYYLFGGKAKNDVGGIDKSVVNNTGNVNNVLINNETISVEYNELIAAIYIICAIKIFEFILFMYSIIMKRLEKKFKNKHITSRNSVNNI